MEPIPITLTLDEFNAEVDQGNILEVSISKQFIRILCPTFDSGSGSSCGAHIRDKPPFLEDLWYRKIHNKLHMLTGCGVCGRFYYRRIGRESFVNGKGH